MREITNNEDIIDSRDIIERIEELEQMWDDPDYLRSEDEHREYKALIALAQEGENDAEDWEYGATLVRESYFVEYAKQLAEDLDIHAVPGHGQLWPFNHIDWEAAADDLATDYAELKFDGVTYYTR